jgi:transglutaminase-like putative cysteine protease
LVGVVFGFGGGKIKIRILLAMLIVFNMALLSSGNIYAATETENITDLNSTQQITENITNSSNTGDIPNSTSNDNATNTDTTTNSASATTTTKPPATGTSTSVPASLKPYLQATKNCQMTNSQIKSLAASITKGKTTTYQKAVAIFNWVRDNLGYTFYSNTNYGAVGTLAKRTGNCCDTTHLLIALERAAGIPARYVHGKCKFTSGNTYGHVWAQVYVEGKWYNADATSSRNTFGVIRSWNTATAKIYGTYASLSF